MRTEHGVDELAVTVDGPIQIAPAARDLHVRLVDVPGAPGAVPALAPQLVGEQRGEAGLPVADGLVRDLVSAFEQQLRRLSVS